MADPRSSEDPAPHVLPESQMRSLNEWADGVFQPPPNIGRIGLRHLLNAHTAAVGRVGQLEALVQMFAHMPPTDPEDAPWSPSIRPCSVYECGWAHTDDDNRQRPLDKTHPDLAAVLVETLEKGTDT